MLYKRKSASLLYTHCLGIETQTFYPSRSRMLLKRKRSMTMHLCYITIVWALVVKRFIPILYFNRRKEVWYASRLYKHCFGHGKSNVSSQSFTYAVIKVKGVWLCISVITVWASVVKRFIPIIYKRKCIPVMQQLFGHWKSYVSSQSVTYAVIKENWT